MLFDAVNVSLSYLFLKFAQVNLYLSTMYAYCLYTYIRYFTSNKMKKKNHGQNSFYLRLENRRNRGTINPLNTYTWWPTFQTWHTCASINIGVVKLVVWTRTSILVKWCRHVSVFYMWVKCWLSHLSGWQCCFPNVRP